ncbi:hypothetical protein DK853_51145, partial [Klebsiella oxytoca]
MFASLYLPLRMPIPLARHGTGILDTFREVVRTSNMVYFYKSDEETLIYFDNVYARATSVWNPTLWYNLLLR